MTRRFLTNCATRTVLAAAAMMAVVSMAFAQGSPQYIGVTYIKAKQGKTADYLNFVKTDGLKMAQAAMDEGHTAASYMLRLAGPSALGSDYNFAQVIWFKGNPSFDAVQRSTQEARAKKAGFTSYQAYLDKRDALSTGVRSSLRTAVIREGEIHVGNYVRTVAVKFDPEFRTDGLRFIQEFTDPLSRSRMSKGQIVGFSVNRPAAVAGSLEEAGYDYNLSTAFKDSDALMAGGVALTEAMFKEVFPTKSYPAYLAELNRLAPHRHNLTTRILEVVTMVGTVPTVRGNAAGGSAAGGN
jgi:hypothetical protein